MYIGFYVQYKLFLLDFNETWIFRQFCEKYLNFIEVHPVEPSCSIRKEGRTDGHDEGTRRSSQFCERA
jgi:hypothetical protein